MKIKLRVEGQRLANQLLEIELTLKGSNYKVEPFSGNLLVEADKGNSGYLLAYQAFAGLT